MAYVNTDEYPQAEKLIKLILENLYLIAEINLLEKIKEK